MPDGTIKEILPSKITGKIEKTIAGSPAGEIGFLDRQLPSKGLKVGDSVTFEEVDNPMQPSEKIAIDLEKRP